MKKQKSFTLVEVLVGIFLVLLIFLGIFGAYQIGLKTITQNKNKITATAIANEQIEKIRDMPYLSIGTQGAVLPYVEGGLEASQIITRNNIEYYTERKVKYIIDEADGTGEEDPCNWDYKRIEIKVSWSGFFDGEVKLVTDIAPANKAEELQACAAQPGGILSVSVSDAFGAMIESPLIEVFNPETEERISFYSPLDGRHDFALEANSFKVAVSKGENYTVERTYGIDEITTPEKKHPIVLEGKITPISFSIDKISSFSINTLSPQGEDFLSDSFLDQSQISSLSDVDINEGEAKLTKIGEVYVNSGYLISTEIEPLSLIQWNELSWNDLEDLDTDLKCQIYYFDTDDWYLIPDSDLSNNSVGFDSSPLDLSGLNVDTYSKLKLKANFSTNDNNFSPILYDWQLSWITSYSTDIPNVSFLLEGEREIGTDDQGNPVYKYSEVSISNGSGYIEINSLQWDNYHFYSQESELILTDTNPSPQPIGLLPDENKNVELFFESENSLLITVQNDNDLTPIFSADVRLYNGESYDVSQYTNEKGQTYFIPLSSGNYNIEVSAPGYTSEIDTVSVSGSTLKIIRLNQQE